MSKRNLYFIDWNVQGALIRRIVLQWCLMVLGLVAVGVLVELMFGSSERSFSQAVAGAFGKQTPLLLMMFMLLPAFLWDVVKLSHRFAGPMLRLRKNFHSMANGGTGGKMKFRPGDFWQETAEEFNAFYEKHAELSERCAFLEQRIQELETGAIDSAV